MKIVQIIFLLLGTLIGAGFASGKEIMFFFAQYNICFIYFLPIIFIIIFFYLFLCFKSGIILKNKNIIKNSAIMRNSASFRVINAHIKGLIYKKYKIKNNYLIKNNNKIKLFNNSFFDILLTFVYLIFSASMFGGTVTFFNNIFSNRYDILIYALIFLIILFYSNKDYSHLEKFNLIVVPVLIFISILFSVNLIIKNEYFSLSTFNNNIFFLLPNSVLYAFSNCVLVQGIIKSIDKPLSKKEIKKICIITSLIFVMLLAICGIGLVKGYDNLSGEQMPFLSFAKQNGMLYVLYCINMFCAILSTLLSCSFCFCNLIKKLFCFKYSNLIACIVILLFSLVGFDKLVENAFPVVGVIGIVMFINSIIRYKDKLHKTYCKKKKSLV